MFDDELMKAAIIAFRDGATGSKGIGEELANDPRALRHLINSRMLALALALKLESATDKPGTVPSPERLREYLRGIMAPEEVMKIEAELRGNSAAFKALVELRKSINPNVSRTAKRFPKPPPAVQRIDLGKIEFMHTDTGPRFRRLSANEPIEIPDALGVTDKQVYARQDWIRPHKAELREIMRKPPFRKEWLLASQSALSNMEKFPRDVEQGLRDVRLRLEEMVVPVLMELEQIQATVRSIDSEARKDWPETEFSSGKNHRRETFDELDRRLSILRERLQKTVEKDDLLREIRSLFDYQKANLGYLKSELETHVSELVDDYEPMLERFVPESADFRDEKSVLPIPQAAPPQWVQAETLVDPITSTEVRVSAGETISPTLSVQVSCPTLDPESEVEATLVIPDKQFKMTTFRAKEQGALPLPATDAIVLIDTDRTFTFRIKPAA
jgi:hypothetical protein